jgi:hypothetical protein
MKIRRWMALVVLSLVTVPGARIRALENSPAIYGWVIVATKPMKSREGRKKSLAIRRVLSSLRDLVSLVGRFTQR